MQRLLTPAGEQTQTTNPTDPRGYDHGTLTCNVVLVLEVGLSGCGTGGSLIKDPSVWGKWTSGRAGPQAERKDAEHADDAVEAEAV